MPPFAEFDGAAGFDIEAEFCFPVGGVGAVAGEAFVGEDGADVAVEFSGKRWPRRNERKGRTAKASESSHWRGSRSGIRGT